MFPHFEVAPVPAALAVALTALLAAQLLYNPPAIETVTSGAAHWLPPVAITAPLPSADAIEARPLFNPTRGAAAAADQADSAAATIDGFALFGVASRGRRAVAVLRGADATIHTVGPGQQLVGWTLDAVRPDSVVLVRGDERRTIAVGATATKGPDQ
ncbi:hypothetical protein KZX46_13880 [Polymorphobacter sp. PAMC 29334]|uniref:type II secretion system protein N n=1 Tax=Polymorphobacter sp. PAMC 29334 TaxID=2862331 RepID=UPI001C76B903|nr:type II secretion system protein N [Polymorphobacter sp. PAMC 29334]QYE33908.1 hypothetical protein KZX46_13880 [Polymorphobacter sp. PAMC 29334]